MRNLDVTRMVTPQVSSPTTDDALVSGLSWKTQRIGLDLLNDETKDQLNSIQQTLESTANTLDRIQKIVNTVLTPIIAILRAIDDPFAAVIQQLVSEAEKILQAFENQGIFVLDMVTDKLANNATLNSFLLVGDGSPGNPQQLYLKAFNQSILRARAGSYDPDLLAEAGLTIDTNPDSKTFGQTIPDKTSSRNQNVKMTASEAQAVANTAQDYTNALTWVKDYNNDAIRVASIITEKFKNMYEAVLALNPGVPLMSHFNGLNSFAADEDKNPVASEQRCFFNLEALSNIATDDKFSRYLEDLFKKKNADFGVVNWTQSVSGLNLNSTKLLMSGLNLSTEQFVKESNEVINLIKSLAGQIKAIDDKYKKATDFSTKKGEIYAAIEQTLKTQDGTFVKHRFSTGNIAPVDEAGKNLYVQTIKDLLNDPAVDVAKKNRVITHLISANKTFQSAADFNTIAFSDVNNTFAGFINTKAILDRLIVELTNTSNREIAAFQRAIDFLNTQVEFQGLVDNQFKPPVGPKALSNQTVRPSRMTTSAGTTPTSSSNEVKLSRAVDSKAQAVLESVTAELDRIDSTKVLVTALKAKYSGLISALNIKIRRSFGRLNNAVLAIEDGCSGATQIDSGIEILFHELMSAITDIKISFYPFQLNSATASKLKENVTDDSAKNALDLEILYNDTIIGSGTRTPYSEVVQYLKDFVEVCQDANNDPFKVFQQGYQPNQLLPQLQQAGSLNERIEFLAFFSVLSQKLFAGGVQMPTFFIENVNAEGFTTQTIRIFNTVGQITENNFAILDRLRTKVLSDLAEINDAVDCMTGSGASIPDRVKQRNNDLIKDAQALLDETINRNKSLQKSLEGKVSQVDEVNKRWPYNEKVIFVDQVNNIVNQIGGFKYAYNPTSNKVEVTGTIVTGSVNEKIIGLNTRINRLKGSNIARDRSVADEQGDTNLSRQVFKSLAVAREQLASTPENAKNTPVRDALKEQITYLENIQKTIIGSIDAGASQVFINQLQVIEEINRGILGLQRIINEINAWVPALGPTFTSAEKSLLLGDADSSGRAYTKTGSNNYDVSDRVTTASFVPGIINPGGLLMSDDDVIAVFMRSAVVGNSGVSQAEIEKKLKAFIEDSNVIRTDADYSLFTGLSSKKGAANRGFVPLGFQSRLEELQKIKAGLKMSVNDAKQKSVQEKNQSFFGTGNWITPTSKDAWIKEFVTTLRDKGDIRRPIFVDDVSKSKALNATMGLIGGPALGEKAQKEFDKIVKLGEMTVIFYVAASTDVQKVLKDIETLYNFLIHPEKFQAKLDEFARKIAKTFEDLENLFNSTIRGIEDYYGTLKETVADRVTASVGFKNDKHCRQNFVPQMKTIRTDRWMAVKISDFYLIAYAFNAIQKFFDYVKNAFTPKLGLGDLLQDLLDFINNRIKLLKAIATGISTMIEMIDFIGGLSFETAVLQIDNVKSINQLEKALRTASNFPQPFYAPNSDDPMYILAIVVAMPTVFYEATYKKWFHEKPQLVNFSPDYGFRGGTDNVGAGQTSIGPSGISGATGGAGAGTGGVTVSDGTGSGSGSGSGSDGGGGIIID